MTPRRYYLAAALGALCAVPSVLLVRRVADAQRRQTVAAAPSAAIGGAGQTGGDAGAPARVHVATIDGVVEGFNPAAARRDRGRYVADLSNGRRAQLTVEPGWQRAVAVLLEQHQIPRAAVLVMDTDTGRVRVYASRGEPGAPDLVRDTTPPAASVFKIVTASALVSRGVGDQTVTCYSGGFHALHARDLVPDARRDRECVTLGEAFGRSINTVFARRAVERLTPADLSAAARGWGFGEQVPFDAPVSVGALDVPEEQLEFARTAAGFWHSHLSPVHGAMMAAAIARGGEMPRPWMVESITDAHGQLVATGAPHVWRRVVSPEVAAALGRMMVYSVSEGTAFRAFHDDAGRAFLPDVSVSGKTGTLTGAQPYRAYTWFVGNAANASTRVSFAVMVANGPVWRVKAATLARQVLQIVYRGRATD
jgi:cell division protein FtsI/penicillin-binding protein 2